MPSRRIKYSGINLTKEVEDFCNENQQIFMNKVKEDINR
jgi:hypothetical protein